MTINMNVKVFSYQMNLIGTNQRIFLKCGWKLLVEWKDGSVDWVPQKDLKQSNPVELAEYDVANEISDEPALNWWVKETL